MSPTEFQNAIRKAVGAEFRAMRERAGLTQGEVARRMCSHRPIVCRIERGTHTVSINTAIAYVSACDGEVARIGIVIDRVIASVQTRPALVRSRRFSATPVVQEDAA